MFSAILVKIITVLSGSIDRPDYHKIHLLYIYFNVIQLLTLKRAADHLHKIHDLFKSNITGVSVSMILSPKPFMKMLN